MSLIVCSRLKQILLSNKVPVRTLAFKSDLSLDKLYPNSTDIKPFSPPSRPDNQFSGYIPMNQLIINHCKSSGPGGQNVNKRSTKVDMRFHVQSATWLSDEMKTKLLEKYPTKINKEGYFHLQSERTKETLLNTLDVVTKLREILFKLDEPPEVMSEDLAEKIRKGKEKAVRERLMEKRKNSLKKQMNRNVTVFD